MQALQPLVVALSNLNTPELVRDTEINGVGSILAMLY